jgi:fibronectin-binding autotransporter adhesin
MKTRSLAPLRAGLLFSLAVVAPFAFGQIDIPNAGNATISGGSNSSSYTLTADAIAEGYGDFTGTFNTNNHTLTVESQFPGPLSFSGVISGTAVSPLPTLSIFAADNAVILNGNNTFTGDVVIQAGTLQLGHTNALGAGFGVTRNVGSATIDLNGQQIADEVAEFSNSHVFIINNAATDASWGGSISFSTNPLTFKSASGNITLSGNLSGGGSLAKEGAYTLTISGDNSGLVDLWNLGNGTLRLGSQKAVGSGVGFSGTNATLDLNGQIVGDKQMVLLESGIITNTSTSIGEWFGPVQILHSKNLTLDAAAGNLTIYGAIGGNGSITKTGSNTLTLSSNSTDFTGNFIIDEGLAQFDGENIFLIRSSGINNSISGAGEVYFNGTWVFDLMGAGTTVGNS